MQITSNTNPYIGSAQTTEVNAAQQPSQTSTAQATNSTASDTVTLSEEALALAASDNLPGSGSGNEPPAVTTLGSGSGNEPQNATTLGGGWGNEPPDNK